VAVPQTLTKHLPQVNWQNRRIVITIVRCGGTGSQIATGMPYLHQALLASGHPYGLRVFLVDGDRITETNCVRQPFSRSEVGLYKAVVLINRLNMFWGLDWEAVPHFVQCGQDVPDSDFLISCVDTRAARAVISRDPRSRPVIAYISLASVLISCSVWFWPNLPRAPKPESGNIFPMNMHGTTIYWTQNEVWVHR
jgi:hypothetical protein